MNKKEIHRLALERMKRAADADRENREEGLDDLRNLTGVDLWPSEIRDARKDDNKPCLTVNQLPQHVRQVTGDIRRMNPAINITAADDGADPEVAELIEDLIRRIEYGSDASSVYEGAAERAAAGSIGWFRIRNDWESDDSFNQEIFLTGIRNSNSVYCDPEAEHPTRSDANFLFITQDMSKEEFEKAYPGKDTTDFEYDGATDLKPYWSNDSRVVVAEYYWKEPVKKTIGLLSTGEVVDNPTAAHDVIRTREVSTHKVMWAKMSGDAILEGPKDVPSKDIPVIAVTGEEWDIGDRVYRSSVIRFAKDPQRVLNYSVSTAVETVSLQPKSPWLVTPKQIAGLETFWAQANVKNRPYLPYNPDDKAPMPQRVAPAVSSQALSEQIAMSSEFMKSTTGIYDASLGQRSNETSGVAIRQRQMESDLSTSIYSDNMAKAIHQAGRIIVDMIPKVYDTARNLRVLGKDGTERPVAVNQPRMTMDGVFVENDLTVGKYGVRVEVGPNYSTRRQETAEGMMAFIKSVPGAAQVTGDLLADAMDWPNKDQFVERLKLMLPPGMRDPEDMSPEEQAMAQQAMAQQAQQAQMQAVLQQMALQKEQIGLQKDAAEAKEAEADAQKAGFEVMDTQLEVAAKTGAVNEAIAAAVQQGVARALAGLMQANPY